MMFWSPGTFFIGDLAKAGRTIVGLCEFTGRTTHVCSLQSSQKIGGLYEEALPLLCNPGLDMLAQVDILVRGVHGASVSLLAKLRERTDSWSDIAHQQCSHETWKLESPSESWLSTGTALQTRKGRHGSLHQCRTSLSWNSSRAL